MTPPIASPHVYEEKRPPKPPFRGLRIFIVADLVVLMIVPLTSICQNQPHKSWAVIITFYALYLPLWCLLLWHLWRGSGIALAIFWWTNVISVLFFLLNGFKIEGLPQWLQYINFAGEGFVIFSLIWLQLPGVKAHFRRDKSV
ncbi:hypothetical protein IAD21_02235 [Abditibacteriota bacterium]|nr:hypothetical protein IAD21_02235 [Abditibacteriota bacterium]